MSGLVKAEIKGQDKDGADIGMNLDVCFNPREYTLTKIAPWAEHHNQGMDAPKLQWTTGAAQVLSVELFFDVYEETGSARDVRLHTNILEKFQLYHPDLHYPPILHFCWGKRLQFKCVLHKLDLRFTFFLDDGTPVRAVANCQFVEYTPPSKQRQGKPLHSPDHTKRRIVKEGDTLSWIAGKEYGNPAEWRIIADANSINDPMHLTVGTELLIPPLY